MKSLLLFAALAIPALAGWGEMETAEYKIFTQRRDPSVWLRIGLPIPPTTKPSAAVFVTAKDGAPAAKEHKISARFVGADGKTYRQTLTAIPNPGGGFYAVFDIEALDILSVDIERVNPPIIQEAQ